MGTDWSLQGPQTARRVHGPADVCPRYSSYPNSYEDLSSQWKLILVSVLSSRYGPSGVRGLWDGSSGSGVTPPPPRTTRLPLASFVPGIRGIWPKAADAIVRAVAAIPSIRKVFASFMVPRLLGLCVRVLALEIR